MPRLFKKYFDHKEVQVATRTGVHSFQEFSYQGKEQRESVLVSRAGFRRYVVNRKQVKRPTLTHMGIVRYFNLEIKV